MRLAGGRSPAGHPLVDVGRFELSVPWASKAVPLSADSSEARNMILPVVQRLWVRGAAWRGARRQDGGSGLVEYSLLLALIALVCFAAITFFGQSTSSQFSVNADCFDSECH
jgi:Flp pilus assembly pilin Flp